MPNAPWARSTSSLLPAGPRRAACTTQDPSRSDRGARPPALGLRCHRARGMANRTKLLGHIDERLTQPPSSFYPPVRSDGCGLQPQRPSWRRWPGESVRRAQVALAPRPWLVQRQCAAWACEQMPNARWARLTPLSLPAGPRSAACVSQDPSSCSDRGARPAALGLRCHRLHGTVKGAGLLGHAARGL